MTKFRKGSMGAADEKSAKRFLIGATIIVSLIFSMVYLNFPHTFLNDYHRAAGSFWKVVGVFPFIGSVGFMWFGRETTWGEKGGWQYGAISIGLLALGIFCGCGWTFDLK